MVAATDPLVGETHAMRVDAVGERGGRVSFIQAHDSFRQCVGQSCAEFVLDMLGHRPAAGEGGVWLPEALYASAADRRRLLARMTSTEGTLTYRMQFVPGRA
mmetsp:Transcript_111464/g.302569  ORF Transcript_111464/g.302569 Transcript_111464/m.302569 type:complete len:102 (+) Transcript_111464:2-307(+)